MEKRKRSHNSNSPKKSEPKNKTSTPQKPIQKRQEVYVVDTSVLASKKLAQLVTKKGLKGKIIIPDASVAELENQANHGKETGFDGLDEIAKLHELKKKHNISVEFAPPRPSAHQIRFAKSGEIDALIRGLAYNKKAVLITSDFVQAKSAAAYGLKVWFIKAKPRKEEKRFFFFRKN